MHGLIQEKQRVFRGFSDGVLRGHFGAPARINPVLNGRIFLLIVHPRSRVGPVSGGG